MGFCSIPLPCVVLLLIVSSCFVTNKPCVYGVAAGEVPNLGHVVHMDSLRPASSCCTGGSNKGVQVMHRYGPCSPLNLGDLKNSLPNSHLIFLKDQFRVHSMNSKSFHSNTRRRDLEEGKSTSFAFTDRALGAGNYLVTVGFGTPKQDLTLILDTGSDITWIQSKPCSVRCYTQRESIFDPSASSTYSNASCSSSSCDYYISYADKSYSRGHYGNDTLTLPGSGIFPNFIFGCGQENSDGFGGAAGMLGLSQGSDLSVVSQTYSKFAKIFCYCLTAKEGSTGYALFGIEALETCQTEAFTPLLSNPDKPLFYFVNLIGITIGSSKRLAVSSFLSSSPNTIIDSGTVITRLPPSVYSGLRAEFRKLMSMYPLAPPLRLLDTCYNLTGLENVVIPKMVLHFEDLSVNLDPSGVVWRESDEQVCLGFAGNENTGNLTIIGNNQQRTLGILYDIQDNKVEFRTNAC